MPLRDAAVASVPLEAVETPGHASDHLAYVVGRSGLFHRRRGSRSGQRLHRARSGLARPDTWRDLIKLRRARPCRPVPGARTGGDGPGQPSLTSTYRIDWTASVVCWRLWTAALAAIDEIARRRLGRCAWPDAAPGGHGDAGVPSGQAGGARDELPVGVQRPDAGIALIAVRAARLGQSAVGGDGQPREGEVHRRGQRAYGRLRCGADRRSRGAWRRFPTIAPSRGGRAHNRPVPGRC